MRGGRRRSTGRLLGRVGPAGGLAGWALLAPSATVALARLTRRESRTSVLMLEALTPLLTLPVVAALGAAVATRRRAMASVAGLLGFCHLVWLARDRRPGRRPAEGADDAPRFRLLSANILFTKADVGGIVSEIAAADPDVVVLQEVSPLNFERLEAAEVLAAYPHRWVAPRPDGFGNAILSRLPLEGAEEWRVDPYPMARATLVVGERRVRLYDVHTGAPFGPLGARHWRGQLAALRAVAQEEREPLVLAGDFNATFAHRDFRRLLEAGVRDVHVDRRRRLVATWPLDLRPLPPLLQLDYVLVSDQVAVLDVWEGTGRGSDHRPLLADLAVVG